MCLYKLTPCLPGRQIPQTVSFLQLGKGKAARKVNCLVSGQGQWVLLLSELFRVLSRSQCMLMLVYTDC